MPEVEIDVSSVIEVWRGSDSEQGTHGGGELEGLRLLLDAKLGAEAGSVLSRMKFFDETLLTSPFVWSEDMLPVQQFKVLQGDVVQTDLAATPFPLVAYGNDEPSYFIVKPNSCFLQRLKQVEVVRLHPVTQTVNKRWLKQSVLMRAKRWFFLPSLPGQADDVLGNIVNFDEVSVVQTLDLENANRVASLTEFGWHIFSQLQADFYSKPSEDDYIIRQGTSDDVISIDV